MSTEGDIDPNIICKICGDWYCITVNHPVCFPICRVLEPEHQEECGAEETVEDFVEIDGYVYVRLYKVSPAS